MTLGGKILVERAKGGSPYADRTGRDYLFGVCTHSSSVDPSWSSMHFLCTIHGKIGEKWGQDRFDLGPHFSNSD